MFKKYYTADLTKEGDTRKFALSVEVPITCTPIEAIDEMQKCLESSNQSHYYMSNIRRLY